MKNVEDIYPLTQAQADLLRESLASPLLARVHWLFAGEFDSAAFESAWQNTLARHTSLRACFLSEGLERPAQVIRERVKLLYERHDLSGIEPGARRAGCEALLSSDRSPNFNPARAPLFRLIEVKLGAGARELVIEHHPLSFDGRSAELLMSEALAVYGAGMRGEETHLPPAIPFRVYGDWVERQDLAVAEFYWRKTLRGAERVPKPGFLAGGDAPEPAGASAANLTVEETAGARAFAHQHGLSVETLVIGAWALALMRERGSREEIVGALVGGRPPSLPASGAIIGRIENALPLRVSLARGESLMSFLEKIERGRAELERLGHVSGSQIRKWRRMDADERLYDNEVYARVAALETEGAGLRVSAGARHEATRGSSLALEAALGDELSLKLRARRGDATGALAARLIEGVIEALRRLIFPATYFSSSLASRESGPEIRIAGSDARGGRSDGVERVEAALRRHPAVRETAVVGQEQGAAGCVAYVVLDKAQHRAPARQLDFSLFYFADDNAALGEDKYRLYLEGARFADRHGFAAVWTPERHFHEKAGLYPNPSVLSAALATITEQVGLRAGSVVLPLHDSLRVAEEWSVVDNISRGRVGVSFTSGWMPNDFAFYPERYANKREEMFRGIEEVRELWRGQSLARRDGAGKEIEVRIFPKPIQPELPMWLTCSGGPEMFERAGALGCHVLTALLAQSLEDVVPKIQLYRESLERHGHDPARGKVTMMMHTFISEDPQVALEKVRAPLTNYLKSHVDLIESGAESLKIQVDLSEEEYRAKYLDQLAAFAFERYYRTASLIGSPTSCLKMIDRLRAAGVDEVASLIDFGVDVDATLASLSPLLVLKEMCDAASEADASWLADFVKAELPDYRAPIEIVVLDALPLTATGAFDYVALSTAAR